RQVVGLIELAGLEVHMRLSLKPGSKTCTRCFLKSATYIRPSRSKRAPLPIPPSGSVAKGTDLVAPGLSLPMTPSVPRFMTNRLPAASTAGPSIRKVYSPCVSSRLVGMPRLLGLDQLAEYNPRLQ